MKNYQKPLMTDETLVADTSIALDNVFDIISGQEGEITDDEA